MEKVPQKAYLNVPWGQVHYRSVPAAAHLPVLLLLHQSPLSSARFERLLPRLAAHCRPYALDTPGYGASSPAPAGWEVGDYAAAVWACAERLGAREVVLFGRATGALFAYEAALAQPERVRCLVLHGLPVYTEAERTERLAGAAAPYPPRADGAHLQAIWQRIHKEYPWIDPPLAHALLRDWLAAGPDFASAYRAIWRHTLAGGARRTPPVPTLLVAGTRDRIYFMHERAAAFLPAAQTLVLEGATDFVAEQDPDGFARHLTGFMSPGYDRTVQEEKRK